MKRTLTWGIISCLFLVISPSIAKGGPAGPPEGLDVKIVNPLPVPVEGDLAVTNDENNPVPVSIINNTTVVKNSDQPGRLPYQQRLSFSGSSADASYYHLLELPAVPEGKRLVIEHISAIIKVDRDTANLGYLSFASPDADYFVNGGDDIAIIQPSATRVTLGGYSSLMIDRAVRAYYEPETIPKVKVEVVQGLFDESYVSEICVVGYLIDADN